MTGLRLYAAFVLRLQPAAGPRGLKVIARTPRYVGHVIAANSAGARLEARRRYGVQLRSCDLVRVQSDNGRRRWYGQRGAGAPGGVGLL